jgi:hypothetical protein
MSSILLLVAIYLICKRRKESALKRSWQLQREIDNRISERVSPEYVVRCVREHHMNQWKRCIDAARDDWQDGTRRSALTLAFAARQAALAIGARKQVRIAQKLIGRLIANEIAR